VKIIVLALTIMQAQFVSGQRPERYNSSDIQLMLEKLQVLGNVLYVAAHPDDENTAVITYFANERKLNTAYFSFTRGDGGQNLIGPEIREKLGLIRTHELLKARKIDNGQQFFSRAVDFGYSKHPDETFNIWDRENVLGDLVWIIRKFRPDIIITRFNPVPGTTHGHHTASAMFAAEAMDLAGNPKEYEEQLTYVQPWQPKSLYWNAYTWRMSNYLQDTSTLLRVDVGKYNELMGMSYSEIAALSRSSHKSQGFGVTGSRGKRVELFQWEKGYKPEHDILEGIDVTWSRVAGGDDIGAKVNDLIAAFDPKQPSLLLKDLLNLRSLIKDLDDDFWKSKKIREVDEIIYAVTGLYLELKAEDFTACPGESLKLDIEAINRSDASIKLLGVEYKELGVGHNYDTELKNNSVFRQEVRVLLPENLQYTQPYWLSNPHTLGMFNVSDQQQIGKPVNGATIEAVFSLEIEGEHIEYRKPIVYKTTDPVQGEVYKPFYIIPPVFANIGGDVNIFNNHKAQTINVYVRAGKDSVTGSLSLNLPNSWEVIPSSYEVSIDKKNSQETFQFQVTPPEQQEVVFAQVTVSIDNREYSYNYTEIDYEHIPLQILFEKSESKFVKLDLEKGNEKIGYVMGAGDNIPENLRQIGYEVEIINDLEFSADNLDQYQTIILGIRALNTVDRLAFELQELFDWVERGGNMVVQYNTSHRLVTKDIAPFPLQLSRDRITVEEAEVELLLPNHEVLNYPNKISEKDFEGWVQERGLYFPNEWSEDFTPLLSSHDPGEPALEGGLLVAKHGKGRYIYTGYSWFRELPAGVPGAYRIFVNLISNRQ